MSHTGILLARLKNILQMLTDGMYTLKMIVIHKRYEKRATIRSFFVSLQEFSAFLYIKAVWGIDENLGYELETVLNSTFYYEMHSMNTRRCATSRFNDSSSGAKVNISFERTKSIFNFFI